MYNDKIVQKGWVCPLCGRVMAPTMVGCVFCNTEKEHGYAYEGGECSCGSHSRTHKDNSTNSTGTTSTAKEIYGDLFEAPPEVKVGVIRDGELIDEDNLTDTEKQNLDAILTTVMSNLLK